MILSDEKLTIKQNRNEISESSQNISFSSNNSFYATLEDNIKKDIIFLIKAGYEKRTIIKLYIILHPSNVNEAIQYLSRENGIYQHNFFPSEKLSNHCEICGQKRNTIYDGFVPPFFSEFSKMIIRIFASKKRKFDFFIDILSYLIYKFIS